MTILGITISAAIVWLILAAIFGLVEALTVGLTTIWFAGGAVVAAITALAGGNTLVQIAVFLVVSIVLLIFTRPFAKKKLKIGNEMTNVDALIGKEALVTETIKPFTAGQAKVDGLIWTAIAANNEVTIKSGTTVQIERVEGVKLVVSTLSQEA